MADGREQPSSIHPVPTFARPLLADAARPPANDRAAGSPARRRSAADRATARRLLERLWQGDDRRDGKIAPLQAKIRDRAYENALKLSVAVERMIARECAPAGRTPIAVRPDV